MKEEDVVATFAKNLSLKNKPNGKGEDTPCMMMQYCFLDPALKAKLGVVPMPTLAVQV